jgi:hypothetical protein
MVIAPDGNLDRLEAAVAEWPPLLEGLMLEFELCYLKLEYGGSCDPRARAIRAIASTRTMNNTARRNSHGD